MSNDQKHSSHAQHNIDFLSTFYAEKKYRDWVITVCFYIAVHIIEAVMYKLGKIKIQDKEISIKDSDQLKSIVENEQDINIKPPNSIHLARLIIVNYNFPEIKDIYFPLYNLSKTARYVGYNFAKSNFEYVMKECLKKLIEWSNENHNTAYNDKDMFS